MEINLLPLDLDSLRNQFLHLVNESYLTDRDIGSPVKG
jgi:hypothetical protein